MSGATPQTGQFLLAFSSGIKNLGAGALNVVGYRNSVTGNLPNPNTMPAYQRLSHADGSCDELQIGTMTYHDLHHHWHLDGVMSYELLDAKLKPVKPNSKVAFCLADVAVADSTLPGFPTAPAYNGCDPNARTTYVNMGTSVGWEDIYDKMLFGQNFDVTDLMNRPQAQYFIGQTVDEAGIIFEQNDANNTTGVWVTLGVGVPYSTGGPRPGVSGANEGRRQQEIWKQATKRRRCCEGGARRPAIDQEGRPDDLRNPRDDEVPVTGDFEAGVTGLEPETSGVTGRSWRLRAERV